TGELNQAEVIECVFVVANENRPALGKPTKGTLDDPATRLMLLLATRDRFLVADSADVRRVFVFRHGCPAGRVVVSLVQAKILGALWGRFRAFHDDGFNGGSQQFGVVNIGPVDHGTQGTTVFLDNHAAFRARLAAICGIWADFIPPKRALAKAPSADCQSQLTPPSSSQSLNISAQMRSITPSRFQR